MYVFRNIQVVNKKFVYYSIASEGYISHMLVWSQTSVNLYFSKKKKMLMQFLIQPVTIEFNVLKYSLNCPSLFVECFYLQRTMNIWHSQSMTSRHCKMYHTMCYFAHKCTASFLLTFNKTLKSNHRVNIPRKSSKTQ